MPSRQPDANAADRLENLIEKSLAEWIDHANDYVPASAVRFAVMPDIYFFVSCIFHPPGQNYVRYRQYIMTME